MVTYYNTKDMVSFANYMMDLIISEERTPDADGNYQVYHADFQNWLDLQKK